MVASQMGMLSMGLVDTFMVGRLGPEALAAVALGDLWTFASVVIAQGLLMGLDPIVSQAHGRRDGEAAGRAAQRGCVLAVLLTVPVSATWLAAEPALVLLGQDPELAAGAALYARAQIFCVAPYLGFVALRSYVQGRERMAGPFLAIVVANAINVFFNQALIFGDYGFPALGIEGSAIASGLARTTLFSVLALWVFGLGHHRGAWPRFGRAAFQPAALRRILLLGLPIGLQFGLEVWAFSIAMLMAGRLGTEPLAAHTIVMRMASFSFMMPVGISIAAATRIGNLIGADRRRRARRAAWVAIGMGAGVMTLSAGIFAGFRHQLPALFSSDLAVIALGASVLPIAAAFQWVDGIQCVGAGVLRGMGSTRPAAIFALLGFFGLALPLGWYFAFELQLGLPGIWWGLAGGLGAVAALLTGWIATRSLDHFRPLDPSSGSPG